MMIEIPNPDDKVAPFDRYVAKTLATLFFAETPKPIKFKIFWSSGSGSLKLVFVDPSLSGNHL